MLEYADCPLCGETVIVTYHWFTHSRIELNPLPHPEGTVNPDFRINRCAVIPIKATKKYTQLWQPHIATCQGLKEVS